MIKKYTNEATKDNLNVYYLALSAFQKCVRRGRVEQALNFAKVVWRFDPSKLWFRLWTVVFEDCGRDPETLWKLYKHREGYNNFEALIPLITQMTTGKHDRQGVALSDLILKKPNRCKPVQMIALLQGTGHEKVLELSENWPNLGVESYDVWDFGIAEKNFDWVIDLCERGLKFDRSLFCVAAPYFFIEANLPKVPIAITNENIETPLYADFLPLAAIDDHTRPGKRAAQMVIDNGIFKQRSTLELDWYVFCAEGWNLANYCPYPFSFYDVAYSMFDAPTFTGKGSFYYSKSAIEGMESKVLPKLNEFRRYVLKNFYDSDISMLKNAYESDYIKV